MCSPDLYPEEDCLIYLFSNLVLVNKVIYIYLIKLKSKGLNHVFSSWLSHQ